MQYLYGRFAPSFDGADVDGQRAFKLRELPGQGKSSQEECTLTFHKNWLKTHFCEGIV